MSNYPPGIHAGTPDAPWNLPEESDLSPVVENLTGQDFYQSGNHDVEASLDAYEGRLDFDVPDLHRRSWVALSEAEREAFEVYAQAVRMFAGLYGEGLPSPR